MVDGVRNDFRRSARCTRATPKANWKSTRSTTGGIDGCMEGYKRSSLADSSLGRENPVPDNTINLVAQSRTPSVLVLQLK